MRHHDLTGRGAIHPFAFIGATDPALDADNEVTIGKAWIDTSAGFVLKVRNAGNDGWDVISPVGVPVITDSSTARDADPATDAGCYIRFTNAAAKIYTFDDGDGFSAGQEFHVRNAGAGDLTLTAAGTMTLNAPAGGTLVVPEGGTATVKMVASDEADVFGVTEPA
jgi:hypothetical protein